MENRSTIHVERPTRWPGLFAFTGADRAVWSRLLLPFLFLVLLGFGMGFLEGYLGTASGAALLARQIVFGLCVLGLALSAGWASWRWWSLMDEMERKIEGIVHVAACVVLGVGAISLHHLKEIFAVAMHEDVLLVGILLTYLSIRAVVRWRLRAL